MIRRVVGMARRVVGTVRRFVGMVRRFVVMVRRFVGVIRRVVGMVPTSVRIIGERGELCGEPDGRPAGGFGCVLGEFGETGGGIFFSRESEIRFRPVFIGVAAFPRR